MAYFSYQRSTRAQAGKQLMIAAGFPVIILTMMSYFGGAERPQQEFMLVGGIASLVSLFMLIVFVIPNYRKNAVFRYVVDTSGVTCDSPDGDSYRVSLQDIARLHQIKRMAGQMEAQDFIETVQGESYRIPMNYDLNIYRVKKAIKRAKPNVVSESSVRY